MVINGTEYKRLAAGGWKVTIPDNEPFIVSESDILMQRRVWQEQARLGDNATSNLQQWDTIESALAGEEAI